MLCLVAQSISPALVDTERALSHATVMHFAATIKVKSLPSSMYTTTHVISLPRSLLFFVVDSVCLSVHLSVRLSVCHGQTSN